MNKKIILAGGTGLLGSALSSHLIKKGYQIVLLSRQKGNRSKLHKQVFWDGINEGDWALELEGAFALFNFSGKSINCIHNEKNKREIAESRINSVNLLNETISKLSSPPACFIQCGALGYYGNKETKCDENTEAGFGFLADLAIKWEEEFFKTSLPKTRKVLIRIGLPLSQHGGLLQPLIKLTRFYLGGSAGSGKQYLSWIHLHDLNRIFEWAIENESTQGIYNGNAPNPVTNEQFMKTLRTELNKPWSPPAPSILVKLGARYIFQTEPSLALSGCFSVPNKLLSEGFTFNFPYLEETIKDIMAT